MRSPPDDLQDAEVLEALVGNWSVAARTVGYRPVGFGSHHWVTDEHFISVDPAAARPHLAAALRTATALRDDAGLGFVVAPIPTCGGSLLAPVGDAWVMHVYPRLTIVDSTRFAPHTDPQVVELVRAIHAATPAASPHAAREDFSIPDRDALEGALDDLDEPWGSGPYADRTRALLAAHADEVRQLLDAHDRLVGGVPAHGWVVTHGEPHRGNIFRTTDGWAVVDWDTVQLAPAERDLWDLPTDCDARRRELYRLRWDLADIAAYVSRFSDTHTGDRNDDHSWASLVTYLDPEGRWPHLVDRAPRGDRSSR